MRNKYTYIIDLISCIVMIIYSGIVLFININGGNISFLQVGIVLAILIALTIVAKIADARTGKGNHDSAVKHGKGKQISNASWIAALIFAYIASLLKMRWELGLFIAVIIIGVPNIILLLKQRANWN